MHLSFTALSWMAGCMLGLWRLTLHLGSWTGGRVFADTQTNWRCKGAAAARLCGRE